MKDVLDALKELDDAMVLENQERDAQSRPCLERATVKILGQMSLVLNEEVARKLTLFSTQDVDAIIKAEWFVTATFKNALERRGLQYDFLSTEIWLPPGASYLPLYKGACVDCEILDPISALVSKAVKAPQKNHVLIGDAVVVFGAELTDKLKSFGVEPAQFFNKLKVKP